MAEWDGLTDSPDEGECKKQYLLQLLNVAQTRLIGASVAGLKAELFDVLRELFTETGAWMEDVVVTVIANKQVYDVEPSSGRIIRLLGVFDQNLVPQPASMPQMGKIFFPFPYSIVQPMTVRVAKNVDGPFENKGVPVFPTVFLSEHGPVLLDGLLAKMYSHPNASYSNGGMAQYHGQRFRDGIAIVRAAAIRANSWGLNAWVYPQQFRTLGQRGGVSVGNAQYFQ